MLLMDGFVICLTDLFLKKNKEKIIGIGRQPLRKPCVHDVKIKTITYFKKLL